LTEFVLSDVEFKKLYKSGPPHDRGMIDQYEPVADFAKWLEDTGTRLYLRSRAQTWHSEKSRFRVRRRTIHTLIFNSDADAVALKLALLVDDVRA
jgi:hypothetical protein